MNDTDKGVFLDLSTLISPWSGERIPYRLHLVNGYREIINLRLSDGQEFSIEELEFFTVFDCTSEIGRVTLEINGAPIEVPYVGYMVDEDDEVGTLFINQDVLNTITSTLQGYPYTDSIEDLNWKSRGEFYKIFGDRMDLILHGYYGMLYVTGDALTAYNNFGNSRSVITKEVRGFSLGIKSLFFPYDSGYYITTFPITYISNTGDEGYVKLVDAEFVQGVRLSDRMEERVVNYLKSLDIQTFKYSNYQGHLQV